MRLRLKSAAARVTSSRVLRTSSIILIGNYVTLVISIVTSAVLIKTLGVENNGLLILAMTSINVIADFLDVRTGEGLIRFMGNALVREERGEALTFFYIGVGMDLVVTLITILIAVIAVPPLVALHPQGGLLTQLITIYILAVPFLILQNNFESLFNTFKKFYLQTMITVIISLFSLVLLTTLASQGLVAVMWGQLIIAGVSFLLFAIIGGAMLLRNFKGAQTGNYRTYARTFFPFAFHTSLMGSLKAVSINIDILLLGALRPASEVTFYKLARSACSLIPVPVTPVNTVLYPLINEAWARFDLVRVRYLVKRLMLYSATISLCIALVFFVLADPLINIIFGTEALPAANIIRLLSFGVVLETVAGWVRTAALASNKPQLVTFSGTAAFLSRVALSLPLVYALGAVGSAIANNVGVVVSVLINAVYVVPRLGLWNPFGKVLVKR